MKRRLLHPGTLLFGLALLVGGGFWFIRYSGKADPLNQLVETHLRSGSPGARWLGPIVATRKTGGTVVVARDSSGGRASWRGEVAGPNGAGEAMVVLELRDRRWQITSTQFRGLGTPWQVEYVRAAAARPRSGSDYRSFQTAVLGEAQRIQSQRGAKAAIAWADSIWRSAPNRLDAFIAAVTIVHRTEGAEAAETRLRSYLRDHPGASDVQAYLGRIYMGQGQARQGDAERYLSAAIRSDPSNSWALHDRGRLYLMMNREREALVDIRKACQGGWQNACADTLNYTRRNSSLRSRPR